MGKSSRKPGSKAAVSHSKQQKTVIQEIAVSNAVKHFKSNARALITMACGSGKTRVGFMTIERMKKTISIIAVPTLGLVKQMRDDAAAWPELSKHSQLLVCSSIRHGDVHERPEDYGLSVTTSPDVILEAMANASTRSKLLIVVTYQSFDKIAAAMQLAKKRKLNVELGMLVCDEAHNTAGDKTKKMSLCLSDKAAKISKRLFLTATPRVIGDRTKNPENHNCMDDVRVYGKNVYSLSFAEAIQKGITSDYEIRNMEVNWKGDAAKKLNSRSFQKSASRVDELARYLAREMKKRPGMRVFSFHTDCASAEAFNAALVKCGVWSRCITGEMPVNEREVILGEFEANGKSRVICSVRVFGEGVDVPSVDTVVFTDPLTSEIQIAQMVGRGQRIEEGKSLLSVYLPIFHPMGATSEVAEKTAKCSYFKTAIKVLRTMSSFDDRVVGEIRSKAEGDDSDEKKVSRSIFNQDGMSAEFAKVVNSLLISKVDAWKPESIHELADLFRLHLKRRITRKDYHKSIGGRTFNGWDFFTRQKFGVSIVHVMNVALPMSDKWLPKSVDDMVEMLRSTYSSRPIASGVAILLGKTASAWNIWLNKSGWAITLKDILDKAYPSSVGFNPDTLEELVVGFTDNLTVRPRTTDVRTKFLGRTIPGWNHYIAKKGWGIGFAKLCDMVFGDGVFQPRTPDDLADLIKSVIQERPSSVASVKDVVVGGRKINGWITWLTNQKWDITMSGIFDIAWPPFSPTSIGELAAAFRSVYSVRPKIHNSMIICGRSITLWRKWLKECGHVKSTISDVFDLAWPESAVFKPVSVKEVITRLRKDHKHRPSFGESPCGIAADKWKEIAERLNTTVPAIMAKAFPNS